MVSAAWEPDCHGYQPLHGPPALRQAWAEMYRRVFGVQLDPQHQVTPLLGSKSGIYLLTAAWVSPGDVVLVPDPAYPVYAQSARLAGGQVHFMPLRRESGYLPDLGSIPAAVLRRARLLWLNYPNNPTTATAGLDFFRRAVDFARRHGLLLCHDAAYARVTYGSCRAPSVLQVPGAEEVAVEFNSLSKSHNMAGWRIGAAVGNAQALEALRRIKPVVQSGSFGPLQVAAVRALAGFDDWIAQRNVTYQRRRDLALQCLREMGLEPEEPAATLYIWCPLPRRWPAVDLAERLLLEAGVSVAPGTIFGSLGERHVRISLGAPLERLEQAFERWAHWWRSNGAEHPAGGRAS